MRKTKGCGLGAICAALMLLSPHAQCAEAASAKGPLTAAEREQCKAWLAEYNQGVDPYNAKVHEIKALEAEIDAERAQTDKERESVDRRDSAAMQALNARILKNNERVAQHDQMLTAITAVADERKQRATQIHEDCDNRPAAPPASRPSPAPASPAQPPDAACSSAAGAKDVERRIEATFAEMSADEKRHQAELDRVIDARAKELSWSKEKRAQVLMQLMASPKFMAFEREKQPYVKEMMSIIGSKPKGAQEECQFIKRIAAMMPAIKAINAREYAFMTSEMRAAK